MKLNKITRQFHKLFPRKFGNYWKKNKDFSNIDKDLKFITNTFIKSQSYNLVSRFWHIMNIELYEHLIKFGFKKFNLTILKIYYIVIDFLLYDDWFDGAMNNLKEMNSAPVDTQLFKKQNNLNYRQSVSYNCLCLLLYMNLKKTNCFEYLSKLQDKTYIDLGYPYIKIDNINITADKIISLLDYEKINRAFNIKNFKNFLEIGAGTGRTCEAILSIQNNSNYVICDIPPSTYISYKRLKLVFPNKKISLLIDLNNKEELQERINSNDISFIFPHQLEMLEKNFFDIIIAINCIHEMDKKIIQYYFNLFNNLTKNFYLSIWNTTKVPYSQTFLKKKHRLDYNKGDYQIPKNWDNFFRESLVYPSCYLSLGYKIKK